MQQSDARTSWDQVVTLERKTSWFSLEVFILLFEYHSFSQNLDK